MSTYTKKRLKSMILSKTMEVSQFLVDEVGADQGDSERDDKKVSLTYHDPAT